MRKLSEFFTAEDFPYIKGDDSHLAGFINATADECAKRANALLAQYVKDVGVRVFAKEICTGGFGSKTIVVWQAADERNYGTRHAHLFEEK